jgi:hypothetical protein
MSRPYQFWILLSIIVISWWSINSRIDRLEKKIRIIDSDKWNGANQPNSAQKEVTVYLSSGGFAHPGEYKVSKGTTVAQLLAAEGEGWAYCKDIQCLRNGVNYSSQTTTNFWSAPVEQGDVFFGVGSNVYYAPSK